MTFSARAADLAPALRDDLAGETERLHAADPTHRLRLRQVASTEDKALPLAAFLSIPEETARQLLSAGNLFAD